MLHITYYIFLDRWNVISYLELQDLNIGIALWLAAGGNGWVYEGHSNSNNEDYQHIKYRSKARILLVGSGADEQCAGYGRHRTKFRQGRYLYIGLHIHVCFVFVNVVSCNLKFTSDFWDVVDQVAWVA